MKIYPAIDLIEGKCVRLTQGKLDTVIAYSEDPVSMVSKFASQGAEAVHIVNLSKAFGAKESIDSALIKMRSAVDIPLQLGGGIHSLASAEYYLSMGYDIVLGSWLLDENAPLEKLISQYGNRIIAAVDCKDNLMTTNGWTIKTAKTTLEMVQRVLDLGFSKMIYTDIDKDGTLSGPNITSLLEIKSLFDGELIASGGIGTLEHIKSLKHNNIPSAIIGKALYENTITLKDALEVAYAHQTYNSLP